MSNQHLNKTKAIPEKILFLVIVVLGMMYVRYTWVRHENEQICEVVQIARSVEATLSKEDLKALEAKPGDIDKLQYQVIKSALKGIIRVNPKARFAYIYAEKSGKIYFMADSEPEDSRDYSPPGQEYTEAKLEYIQPLRDGEERITDALTNRWGTWRSVYIPVKDEATGRIIAVFGMDFNAKAWHEKILGEVIKSSVLVVLVLLAFLFLFTIRVKNKLLKNDINERKLVETKLRESERSKSVLLSNLPGMAYRCRFDHDWTMEFVSEGCLKLTGYENDALRNNKNVSFNDLILPEYREHLWRVWDKAVLDHKPICEEYRILTADHQEKWVLEQGSPIYNLAGEVEALEGLIIDITERKQAEQALLKGKLQYDNLVSRIPVGIYILHSTPEGAFALDYASAPMAEMLNRSIENLLSSEQILLQSIHPDDLAGFIRLNQEGIRLRRPFDWKGRVLVGEKLKWLHLVSSPEPLKNGDVLWHGLVVDITEHRRAEEEITQLNAKLEQRVKQRTLQLENANKELEAFSYSVSHDLRSPLRAIDGWSMALLEDYQQQLGEQGGIYLARVRSEAQRMGYLIDDLLKLSKVTRVEMRQMKVDLTLLVQAIASRLTEAEPARKFEFIIEHGLVLRGDPSMLEIALNNLLDNACKFTGREPVARIEFGKQEIDGKPSFFVRDNGVGFNMASAKNLFGTFQRMHKQSDFPGTGIGLATVQRIIFRHGGRIWAESKPGEGSTFFFTLRYSAEPEKLVMSDE